MAKSISNRTIAKNALISVGAQVISLFTSLLVNLILPKFIDEYEYAYWQTYLLYAGYAGLLHLGILDGIVLRFSKYDYDELDKNEISFFFYTLLIILTIFTACGLAIGITQTNNTSKLQICLVSFSIITKNLLTFASYSFQITNRIKYYASSIIVQRLFYGCTSMLMLVAGINNFFYFCLIDLLTDLVGFIYSVRYNKEIYYPRKVTKSNKFHELKLTIYAGLPLLISNFSSNLIVGSSKIFIQNIWEPLVFGQVSFGFSITHIFLNFVMAISVVLFPSLKRIDPENLPQVYKSIRAVMAPLLLTVMLFYFPGCKILNFWLPRYKNSLIYAGMLLPLIIYSTNVNLLTNNFLKAFRKEVQMLILNFSCIIIEIIGLTIIGYYLKNLEILLLWTVVIIVFRAILAECMVSKLIGISFLKDNMFEALLALLFIFSAMKLNLLHGFLLYGAGVMLYMIYSLKKANRFSHFGKPRTK